MAKMPSGQSRPVPGAVKSGSGAASFSFFPTTLDRYHGLANAPWRPSSTVRIGGQYYRELDDGGANRLVPTHDPRFSAADIAAQRRAVQRVALAQDNPLGGAAAGVAALFGAPQEVQDAALLMGMVGDVALSSAGRNPGQGRGVRSARTVQRASPALPQENVRYRGMTDQNQSLGLSSTVTRSMLNTGSDAYRKIEPAGWRGRGDKTRESRGHLGAKILGFSGRDPRNLVTITQNPTNHPQMSKFERRVYEAVKKYGVLDYLVTPSYGQWALPPSSISLMAFPRGGDPLVGRINNPAGRPR